MDKQEKPILSTIQDIKSGVIDPKKLDKDIRRQIVEALLFEGYNIPQIAQVLNRSEKTIRRDIALIRNNNALSPSLDLVKQLIGDLQLKSEVHWTTLMRMAKTTGGAAGMQGVYLAWKVFEEKMKLLQSLGYLPNAPKTIVADLVHHDDYSSQEKSFDELKQTLSEIITASEEAGVATSELKGKVNNLNVKIEKAKIEHETNKLIEEQKNMEVKNEEQ